MVLNEGTSYRQEGFVFSLFFFSLFDLCVALEMMAKARSFLTPRSFQALYFC